MSEACWDNYYGQMSESAPEHRLAAGEVVSGTYTVEARIGAGAFGAVYRVRHRFLGPQAMKVFRTGPGLPSIDEVLHEARLLTTLIAPHVVRVFDANTVVIDRRELPYMTMELIVAGSLEEVLERKLRLNPLSALKAARQICAGLAVAHGRNPPVVHRDVKPQNVLVHAVSVHGTPQVKVGTLAWRVGSMRAHVWRRQQVRSTTFHLRRNGVSILRLETCMRRE